MESLKSHLSLRSLDARGRPSGTGRPSRTSGSQEPGAHADPFAKHLEGHEQARESTRAEPAPSAEEGQHAQPQKALTEDAAQSGQNEPTRALAPGSQASSRSAHEPAAGALESPSADPLAGQFERALTPAAPTAEPTLPGLTSPEPGLAQEMAIWLLNAPQVLVDEEELVVSGFDPESVPDILKDGQILGAKYPSNDSLGVINELAVLASPDSGSPSTNPQPTPAQVDPGGRSENGLAPAAPEPGPPATTPQAEPERPGHLQAERIERAERILEQVRLHLRPDLREAFLQLQPRELGHLAIHLSVRDGRVRATLKAERPETLEVLEQHLPELRALLEQAGLAADNLELGLGLASQSESRSFERAFQSHSPAMTSSITNSPAQSAQAPSTQLTQGIARHLGIDTFA